MDLMKEENVDVEEKAIRYVAKAGDGSMRDALSLLDQCIAFHLGETLTYENVLEVLGAVDTEIFSKLLRQIINKDISGAIGTLDVLVDEGREMGQMVADFIWYLRNLLLMQSSDDMEDVLDMSKEHIAALKEEAALVKPEVLMRYIRIFSELGNQVKYASQKRILIEIAIIKLCKPQMEKDYESVMDRLASLEAKIANGIPVAQVSAASGTGLMATAVQAPVEKPQLPKAIPEDIQQVIRNWKSILSEIGAITKTYLAKAVPSLGNSGELLLVLDDENAFAYLNENRSDCIDNLKEVIAKRIGKEIEISVRKNENGLSAKESVPDLRDLIQFDIEEENF